MRISSILLVTLLVGGCGAQKPMPVRPITVQVVDQQTKKPLEGVSVYYSLYTKVVQKYVFFIIPNIEPDIGPKIAYKARAVTDKNGEARFHAQDFALPKNERFEMESVVVNIDADMTTRMAEMAKHALEVYYAEGKVRREGPVDNIDIIEDNLISRKSRDEVLFRPNAHYSGAVIRSNAYPPYSKGEISNWFERGENCTIAFNGNSLEKGKDSIVVSLTTVEVKKGNL